MRPRATLWIAVAVLASGCLQGVAGPGEITAESLPQAGTDPNALTAVNGSFLLAPGEWYVLASVSAPGAKRVAFEAGFPESSPDHVVGLALYEEVDGEYDWAVGATGVNKRATVGLGGSSALVLIVVHSTVETSLHVEAFADDTPIALNVLGSGRAQVSYYLDQAFYGAPTDPHSEHNVNTTADPIDQPTGLMVGDLSVATDHAAEQRALTWSFIIVRTTAGAAPHELKWSRFGTESTRAVPVVGPALGFVAIQTETGIGHAELSLIAKGASVLPGTTLHHWTVPLGPELDAISIRARDNVGGPSFPSPSCLLADGWICTATRG